MPGKDGGGGGNHNDILRVDPDAVPALHSAFADALTKVDRQLELVDSDLRVSSWAKDPVSLGASTIFNDRALDGEEDAAVEMLRSYRDQLDVAMQNLAVTAEQYKKIDEDNVTGTGNAGQG